VPDRLLAVQPPATSARMSRGKTRTPRIAARAYPVGEPTATSAAERTTASSRFVPPRGGNAADMDVEPPLAVDLPRDGAPETGVGDQPRAGEG
jgi:hypothetical protein